MPPCLEVSFEQFIKERVYLHNVSPRTAQWYRESFQWLARFPLTDDGLKEFVISMRQKGLKPSSCNNRIRVANAYLKWAGLELKVKKLREEQEVLPTFSGEQVKLLLSHKGKTFTQKRLSALVATLFDCGLRIEEALSLSKEKIDFDNLLLSVSGKGGKHRLVPMSLELRKRLFMFSKTHPHSLLFATRDGTKLGRRDMLRDFKKLCSRLGFKPPKRTLHATRHTFALNYVRKGGSIFHLQKILGHTSLEMVRKYVNLATTDLQAVHNGLSLLSR